MTTKLQKQAQKHVKDYYPSIADLQADLKACNANSAYPYSVQSAKKLIAGGQFAISYSDQANSLQEMGYKVPKNNESIFLKYMKVVGTAISYLANQNN